MAVEIHGRMYRTVAERLSDAHKDHKGALTIRTEIVNHDWLTAGVIVMKAEITTFAEYDKPVGHFTGHAYEEIGDSTINKTSALENAETSAIGRALASAGYSGSEFASADELVGALEQQSKIPTSNKKNSATGSAKSVTSANFDDEISFGKHKGTAWIDIDMDYLDWLATSASADRVPKGAVAMAVRTLEARHKIAKKVALVIEEPPAIEETPSTAVSEEREKEVMDSLFSEEDKDLPF